MKCECWPFKKGPLYERVPYEGYRPFKITDWQRREKKDEEAKRLSTKVFSSRKMTRKNAKGLLRASQRMYVHTTDWDNYGKLDHWPVASDMIGHNFTQQAYIRPQVPFKEDCDGFAIVLWWHLDWIMIENTNRLGICYVHKHMFAVWHDINIAPDFWVLDNGYLSKKMVKASKLFPIKRDGVMLEPKWGFNLYDVWKYKPL